MAVIWLQIIDHVLWMVLVNDNVRWWSCHKPITENHRWSVGTKGKLYTTKYMWILHCTAIWVVSIVFSICWQFETKFQLNLGFCISPSFSSWQTACCSLSVCLKPAGLPTLPLLLADATRPAGPLPAPREIGSAWTAPLGYGLWEIYSWKGFP